MTTAPRTGGDDTPGAYALAGVSFVFQVNLARLAHLTRRVLPAMLERGSGKIVNHASLVAYFHFPGISRRQEPARRGARDRAGVRARRGQRARVPAPVTLPARARRSVRAFVDRYVEHDLLTYASAMSFQVLSALVPFLLFGVGLLGFLSLESVWRSELAPELRPNVSDAAFTVIDDVVENVLASKQVFWVTAGLLLALWEISGAVRTVMGALNTIYRDATRRSWRRRMLVSTALGLAVGGCFLAAIAVVVLGPLLYGDQGGLLAAILFVLRWTAAGGLLLLAVALLLHYAPERHQPLHWVTRGSLLIMGGWIAMSLAFGFYLREIASYGSIFGSLATVVVLIAYLYASSVIFLGGVQIDALARER